MKLFTFLIIVFLTFLKHGSSNEPPISSMEVFTKNLTNLTQFTSIIVVHSLLRENEIDEFTIAKEVLRLPAEFNLESFQYVNWLASKNSIEGLANKIKKLTTINTTDLETEIEEIRIFQSPKNQKKVAEFNSELRKMIEEFQMYSSFMKSNETFEKFEECKQQAQNLTNVLEEAENMFLTDKLIDDTRSQEKYASLKNESDKLLKFLNKSLDEQETFYNIGSRISKLKNFNLVANIGDTTFSKESQEIKDKINNWKHINESFKNYIDEVNKLGGNQLDESIGNLLKYVKNPEPETNMMITVGLLLMKPNEETDNKIVFDFLNNMNELFEIWKRLKDPSFHALLNLVDAQKSINYFREDQNTTEILSKIGNCFETWNKTIDSDGFIRGLEEFEKHLDPVNLRIGETMSNGRNVKNELQKMNLMFNKQNPHNKDEIVERNNQFRGYLKSSKLKDLLFELSLSSEEVGRLLNKTQPDRLKSSLNYYMSSLNGLHSKMKCLNELNFENVKKLINFASKVEEIKKDNSNVMNVMNELENIKNSIEKIQSSSIELKYESLMWNMKPSMEIVWKLKNGLELISNIDRMLNDNRTFEESDSDIIKMIKSVNESIKSFSYENLLSMVKPFMEAAKFEKIGFENMKEFNHYSEDVHGAINAIREVAEMIGSNDKRENENEKNAVNSKIKYVQSSLSVLPFIVPIAFVAFCLIVLISGVIYTYSDDEEDWLMLHEKQTMNVAPE